MSDFALENTKNEAKSPNTLARALLDVVFTKEALKICFATGKYGARDRREMLHQPGLEAVYYFVKKYSLKKTRWCPKGWTKELQKEMK